MTDALLIILCVLIIGQTIYKYVDSQKFTDFLTRVESLLNATEVHSRLNQENKERLKEELEKMKAETSMASKRSESAVKEKVEEVKATVEQVPLKVVKEMQDQGIVDPYKSDSSDKLKTVQKDSTQQS